MLAGRRMPEEEVCPVRDELLGELYHADENCVSDLVATVAPDIRVLLALYCYHRLRHPPSRHAGNWSPSQDVAN